MNPETLRRPAPGEPLRRHRVGPRRRPRGRARSRAGREPRRRAPRSSRPSTARRPTSRARTGPTRRRCCSRRSSCCGTWTCRSSPTASRGRSYATLAAGIRTPDIGGTAGTRAFARAVAQRLALSAARAWKPAAPRGRFPVSPDEEIRATSPSTPAAVFGRRAPLEVEIGSGKARFLIEAARRNPAHDFLGLELSLAYYRICRRAPRARGARQRPGPARRRPKRFVAGARSRPLRCARSTSTSPIPGRRSASASGGSSTASGSRSSPRASSRAALLRIATDHADYAAMIEPLLDTVPGLERLTGSAVPAPPDDALRDQVPDRGPPDLAFPAAAPAVRRGPAQGLRPSRGVEDVSRAKRGGARAGARAARIGCDGAACERRRERILASERRYGSGAALERRDR